jgi:hypothetical protein
MAAGKTIKVTLNLVGLFASYTVTVKDKASVLDVLKQAQIDSATTAKRFQFLSSGSNKVAALVVTHATDAISRKSNGSSPPRNYGKGIFKLVEGYATGAPPLFLALQYYIERKNGENVSEDTKIIAAGDSAKPYPLKSGDVITWRLVGICMGPTATKESAASLAAK